MNEMYILLSGNTFINENNGKGIWLHVNCSKSKTDLVMAGGHLNYSGISEFGCSPYMERMVLTFIKRKVHSRKKSNDEYTKVNGKTVKLIITTELIYK